MLMNRRLSFFCSLILITLFIACSPPEPPPIPPTRSVETNPLADITLRVAVRAGDVSKGIESAIADWEAQTGIQVELHGFSHAYLQEEIFLNVIAEDGRYDVVLIDDPWFPSLAGNDYLMPLSAFNYQADEDFVTGSLNIGMWPPPSGPRPPELATSAIPQLYALPLVGNVQLFWYNKDVIPQPPADISELLTVLIQEGQAQNMYNYSYTGSAGNPIVTEFNAWNWSYGGRIFDDQWQVTINHPESVQALTDWLALLENTSPETKQYTSSGNTGQEVLQNQALASMVWPANIPSLMGAYPDAPNLQVTSLPAGVAQSSQIGHWLLAIPTTAQHKQEAYNFILYATSQEAMRQSAEFGLPPTRTSLLQAEDLVAQYPWFPEIETAINNSSWRPRTPLWTKIEHILGNYLALAAAGQLTPQEALDSAALEIEDVLEKANYYN